MAILFFVLLSQLPEIPAPYTVRTTSNLRAGPGTDYPVLARAEPGDSVWLVDFNDDSSWVRVRYGQDTLWLSASLLYTFDELEAKRLEKKLKQLQQERLRRFQKARQRIRSLSSETWYQYLEGIELSGSDMLIIYTNLIPAGEMETRTARIICHNVYIATQDLGITYVSVRDYLHRRLTSCP